MLWDRLNEWLFIDELRFVVAMHFVWNVAIFNTYGIFHVHFNDNVNVMCISYLEYEIVL